MNIGFDLDNIFISTPPFIPKELIDRLYKKRDNGVLLYRIPGKPEQMVRRATHLPLLRPAIKENMEFLRSISKKDNELYLISSRFKFLEKYTEKIIKRYGLDSIFDKMYFNSENIQPHVFKNKVIKDLKLDMFIDDDLSLIKYAAKQNPKTNFFWLNNKVTYGNIAQNIFSISKLPEIYKLKGLKSEIS